MAKRLEFFDVKKKKKFTTTSYRIKLVKTPRGVRKMAVTISPSGATATRFVKDDFKRS